jgi:putative SOS response-associated peptidase YedK
MCGRFTATFEFSDIRVRWNLDRDLPTYTPRFNVAPETSPNIPVIVRHRGGNECRPMQWGLIPHWAADPSIGNRTINARAETLTELPSFKLLVDRRRCIIPADGFYEWVRHEVACVIVRRRHPTEPAVPSAVPYQERRIGNEPSKSPQTMYSSV